jgi:hypothetical protein
MIAPARYWLRRGLHNPVVHFAAIGAILFALRSTWQPAAERAQPPAPRQPIVITAERIRLLQSDFQQRWGAPPTAAQLRALVDHAVEDEMLYREARVLALGFKDASVRRRLVEKARVVSQRPAHSEEELYQNALTMGLDDDVIIRRLLAEKMRLVLQHDPNDGPAPESAMQDYLERNRERFVQPETVTLTQVFFSESTRHDHMAADAATALARLGTQPPSPAVTQLSDPFPLGEQLRWYSRQQLRSRLGKTFADAVLGLEPRKWSGPIASPYGLHLVWVDEHQPERLPPLDAVREPIALALMKQRATENLRHGLERLHGLYEIGVEAAPADVSAGAAQNREATS